MVDCTLYARYLFCERTEYIKVFLDAVHLLWFCIIVKTESGTHDIYEATALVMTIR